jgi:hypothetical protein
MDAPEFTFTSQNRGSFVRPIVSSAVSPELHLSCLPIQDSFCQLCNDVRISVLVTSRLRVD